MHLERFSPRSALLRPFIKEFLVIESTAGMSNQLLPDTALVMAFRLNGSVWQEDAGTTEALPQAVLTGLRKSVRGIRYAAATANLLIVFREGGLSAFSRVPAHELFGLSIAPEQLFDRYELERLGEQLSATAANPARVALAESFLLRQLHTAPPDPQIQQAVTIIQQYKGLIRIKDLAASLHISQDPLEKRFRAAIGASPKQYASIIRLRELIQKYPEAASLTDAAYEAGYFDQSHFIRDFRLFTGQAPKDFFRSAQFW